MMLGVYDLGGGTFDAAVLRRTATSWQVASEAGIPDLGGVDFDQVLLDRLGAAVPAAYAARWRTIVSGTDPGSRRARHALLLDVRAGKETLSRYVRADIPMPEPIGDATVSRSDFQALIRERLQRTVDALGEQLRESGAVRDPATGAIDPRLAGVTSLEARRGSRWSPSSSARRCGSPHTRSVHPRPPWRLAPCSYRSGTPRAQPRTLRPAADVGPPGNRPAPSDQATFVG